MVLIDPYRIIGVIGCGGMGEFYLADDIRRGQFDRGFACFCRALEQAALAIQKLFARQIEPFLYVVVLVFRRAASQGQLDGDDVSVAVGPDHLRHGKQSLSDINRPSGGCGHWSPTGRSVRRQDQQGRR
jgi:hypothetical protein